ncbi:signal peptidase I [Arthrobacter sp. ISL-5]|uniref:signal peptidase I n=1 Tax=Arthrobacter sp. ISL-5 TaxID=2819111 RepID=UPI001BE6162C|nr:signal peptidase I [Arthrobacter sp. ISL-5]MBT2551551.1 signal peptidase I [Arthrobacter sp. ISL-5]
MNPEEPQASGQTGVRALFSADGWLLFLLSSVSRLYLGVLLSLAAIALLPALLGWQGSVVQSGSMEPHISVGDVVLSDRLAGTDSVPVGGVIEFTSPASAEPGGVEKTRLHRIIAEKPDGTFISAGDANAEPDSTPVKREQITGRARLLVPAIGLPGLWLGTRSFGALALWGAATLLCLWAAVYGARPAISPHSETKPDTATKSGTGTKPGPGDRPRVKAFARRHRRAVAMMLVLAALCILVIAGAAAFSSAAFSATTRNATNTFATAQDWAPPTVTLNNPGSPVKDTVNVSASASDAESGIRDVVIQYLAPGGSNWTTLCTDAAAPYSCAWNTTTGADGGYGLRAIATDNAGHSTTSAQIDTVVANSLLVVLADPGEIQKGTVNLSTTLYNTGASSYTVRVEYSVAGANNWKTLCAALVSPYNCSWNTALFANGYYDLRSVATAGTTSTTSAVVADILVDNQAPAVTMTDPGTPLSGTRTFAATATEADSGVAQVQLQYASTGSPTWTTYCTVTAEPYSCRFDTTTLPNGSYSFRAIATDAGGLSTTSAAITNRIVDNTISSVSVEDPGAYLNGTVTLTAAANSTAGITNVRIQTAPSGTTTWTTKCTIAAAPFTCGWDTTTVSDGLYDLRAVLTDGTGAQTTSATVSARRVDNSPLRGVDIQTVNGAATPGRLQPGDSVNFTYSQQVNMATVSPGWTGAPLAVTLRLRDGNLLSLGNNGDTVDIQRAGSSVNLGSVNLKQNYIKSRTTATFNATMTAATVTVSGVPRTVVTVTLGSIASGSTTLRTVNTASTMVWTPTAAVTNLSGSPSSVAPANETGVLDREF